MNSAVGIYHQTDYEMAVYPLLLVLGPLQLANTDIYSAFIHQCDYVVAVQLLHLDIVSFCFLLVRHMYTIFFYNNKIKNVAKQESSEQHRSRDLKIAVIRFNTLYNDPESTSQPTMCSSHCWEVLNNLMIYPIYIIALLTTAVC